MKFYFSYALGILVVSPFGTICSTPATAEMCNHFEPCLRAQAHVSFCLLVSLTLPDFTEVLFYVHTPRLLLSYTNPAAYKCLVGNRSVQHLLNDLRPMHLPAFILQ